MRTVVLTLFAAVPWLALAAPSLAQNERQELINEVIRKSNAREQEGGFCDTTKWPTYYTPQEAARMYDRDVVGGMRPSVHRYKSHGCGVARTTAVTFQGGRRCITETGWHCMVGGACGHYPGYTLCKDAEGAYIQQQ